ncbi:uncharacterized protein N7483_004508 [Penicillium malachiteum]|uniref:uncharacterized protein n=1 Tax=Penicillium malachiteum TaxID=1324776 RepID=UPI0025477E09|nr:uncharacterized protein N7483_004508 [Penicillium malachiteum]KAJ5730000.1 hypothetical protein N7483_004508 [Penicillium malachiteum]
MLDFDDDASRREKCFTTVTQLPAFVDPKQIPTKKSPFSAILDHPFIHTIEVILTENAYSSIQALLEAKLEKIQCARAFMRASDLLENDFFNTYIKIGNILMISEGRSGSDTVFSLRDGLLKIELGKEIYERTGLVGKPIRSGGRKHGKERFVIELNLRLPSMLHGKKGFDRIVWAFQNVLNQSIAWLFCDLNSGSEQTNDAKPIQKHHPRWIDSAPAADHLSQILVPPLLGLVSKDMPEVDLQEACGSVSEWIALAQMRSPRLSAEDEVDPYLCRYSIPRSEKSNSDDLVSLKWHGLISPQWTISLFSAMLSQVGKCNSWFIISAAALGKQAVEGRDGYTIVAAPNICSDKTEGNDRNEESTKYHAICWQFLGATTNEA